MKNKILFSTLFISLSVSISVKAQTLIQENFEGSSFPPSGWTLRNASLGNNWSQNTSAGNAVSGTKSMQVVLGVNYPNAWAMTPALNLTAGSNYRISYWYKTNNSAYLKSLKVTIGNSTTVASQTTTIRNYTNIGNTAFLEGVDTYTATTTSTFYIGFNGTYPWNTGAGDLFIDSINISKVVLPCTGTPGIGVASGPTVICPGITFPLSLSGTYNESGLNLQWQSASTGTNNFTDIINANNATYSTSQLTSTDYRCKLTCSNSGLSVVSNIVQIATPAFCYCAPTSFCSSSYLITNITFGGINNTTTCINDAYADYTASVAAANVTGGTLVPVSVTVGAGGVSYVAVWIDYNKDGIFGADEYTAIGSGNSTTINKNIFIPSSSPGGITRIRFRVRTGQSLLATDACLIYSYGETEDYSVTINPAKVAILFTPFKDTLYDRIINLTATIKQIDVGLNATDALKPRLWAKKLGTFTWQSIKGNLVNGTANNGEWQFAIDHDALGIRRNSCDSVQFYFVAQDINIPINLGYLPEPGTLHTDVQTPVIPAPIPFGYRLKPRLKDTIYVSTSDCRYQSLTNENGLFQEIKKRKLEGSLTVIIESDLLENGIYDIQGTSLNNNSLTIRPDGGTVRIINANLDNSVYIGNVSTIKLNGVKNVTIDGSFNSNGRFLKFKNNSGTYYTSDTLSNIKIFNSCDSINIKNILFEHDSYSHVIGETSILLGQGNNNNIFVTNSSFSNITAAHMSERHITSVYGNNKAVIKGNEFNNFRTSGILIYSPCDNWVIDSNHFYRTTIPLDYSYNVEVISIIGGGHVIKNNFIGGKSPFCSGGPMQFVDNPGSPIIGIKAAAPSGTLPNIISGNTINNINSTNTVASQAQYFAGIVCDNNNGIINDNIIGNPQSTTASITILANTIYGINVFGNQPVQISNNTVCALANNGINGVIRMYGINKSSNFNGSPSYTSATSIINNRIFNLYNSLNGTSDANPLADLGGTGGIYFSAGLTNLVEQNQIHNIRVTQGHVSGIMMEAAYCPNSSVIQRNRIYDITNTSNAVGSCCGDDLYNGIINGIAVNWEVTGLDILNNQIALTNNNILNPVNIRGIFAAYGNIPTPNPLQRVLYNTVYIGGNSDQNGGSAAYCSGFNKARTVSNNIFYNERTGGTKGHFAYRLLNATTFANAGNNLLVVPDTSLVAQTANSTYVGWTVWKAAALKDSSSFLTMPINVPSPQFFIDKTNGNLNMNTTNDICWYANGKALPINGIAADFDSANIRSTNTITGATDIGADEFSTSTLPPLLTVYGKHILGGADTLACNGRILAVINWGNTGTLPILGNCRWYSGNWPNDPTNNGTVFNARYMNAYWTIPATGGNNYSYSISLFYDSSILGTIQNSKIMVINKKEIGIDGTWQTIKPTIANNLAKSLTIDNQTSFSEFTATDILAVLPIHFLVFNGQIFDKSIKLHWIVQDNDNNSYYEVQRSNNATNFITIGTVFNNNSKDYQFIDTNILLSVSQKCYYKLKIVDRNGSISYSNILPIRINDILNDIEINAMYPNPFSANFNIAIEALKEQTVGICIINKMGQELYKKGYKILKGTTILDVNELTRLPKGNYSLQVFTENKKLIYTITKL